MTSSTGTPSFSTPEVPRADSSSSKHSGVAAKVAATPSYAAALAKDADPTSSKISRATAKGAGTPQDVGTSSHTAAQAPQAVGDLSITPEYAPPPRREHKLPAALQSPYLNGARKVSFSCSRAVTKTYNAVCMFSGRSTRSKNRNVVIINYLSNYATLGHLVDSVKPGGKLTNTIAEIGIHVINGKKKKGATRWVMPLYITTFLQSQQIYASTVKHAFTKSENNLNHRQLVLFPVLQRLVPSDIHSGHYFLIVLNLRNNRFEVLDSMRTLENEALAQCCNTITSGIKQLWKIYYAQTTEQIENYETVQIPVPKQTNNHDCGFHMLMHAQQWDGRLVCELHGNDIPNIRKILAHTWLSYEENGVDWESILNAE